MIQVQSMENHGNDEMVAQFVFLFLACPLPQETSMEMDVKTFNVTVKNKLTTIFHSLYSDQPFL